MSIVKRRVEYALGIRDSFLDFIVYKLLHGKLVTSIRHKFRFLFRLIKWIPTLYNDEDWDYNYLLTIIDFKLSRMQKCLEQDDVHSDIKQTLTKMYLIRNSLHRYRNPEKYLGEDCEDLDKILEFEYKHYEKFFKYMQKYVTSLWS